MTWGATKTCPVVDRPNCLRPEACVARKARHCAGCTHVMQAARFNADPEISARRRERSAAAFANPELRARIAETNRATKADPAWKARASASQLARYERERAALGLLPDETALWRSICHQNFTSAEAARIVIRSRRTVTA